jgi:hypothetical protein
MAMRAGRLRHLAQLYSMSGEPPAPTLVNDIWCAIEPSARNLDMARRGLRAAQQTPIIARAWDELRADRYLTWRGRLWYIDGVASREENNEYYHLSCTELVAPEGTYTPSTAPAFQVKAYVVRSSQLTGQFALPSQANAVVEVARFEYQVAWTYGDFIDLEGVTWDIHNTIDAGDDGVVVRLAANARER